MSETDQKAAEDQAKSDTEPEDTRHLRRVNVEAMDPEEWSWRRDEAEQQGEIL